VIQALQEYSLTIWEGHNKVLHGQNHETDLIVHAQLNADIRRIYKLKDAFADSAKQYFHLPLEQLLRRPSQSRQRWLHLARLVAARASGRGTGQQCSPPTTHTPPYPTKPVQLHHQHWLRQFVIFNKQKYDHSTYPNSFQ
jgi:hypothetical protein